MQRDVPARPLAPTPPLPRAPSTCGASPDACVHGTEPLPCASARALQDENGNVKQDLDLPRNTEGELMAVAEKVIANKAKIAGDDSKYLSLVVLSAMGTEQVVDCTIKLVQ